MGFMDFFKGQFIENIHWENDAGTMVYKFPAYDNAIKMGAKLTVRESQAAIFLNEGRLADVFGPGLYELSTRNLPVLTVLLSWKHLFDSPFKADVIFVNTANFTDLRWGTTNPVVLRDPDFGMVRLRGFGVYSIRVADPAAFLRDLMGTKKDFSTESITGYLKSFIVSGIIDTIGEMKVALADLASSFDEIGAQTAAKLQPRFAAIGLELTGLSVENLSPPEEVEKMVDRRSAMGALGDVDRYAKFQAADALREMANNPGGGGSGMMGTAMELSAGLAMGQMLSQAVNQPTAAAKPPATAADAVPGAGAAVACGQCGGALQPGQKFCAECGAPRPAKRFCAECGGELAPEAKFCSSCGTKV